MLHGRKHRASSGSSVAVLARALVAVLSVAFSAVVSADDISVKQDSYEVFYSTFNSSFLSPKVAAASGVVRAKNRGLINVAIRQQLPDGGSRAVKAKQISGTVFDLIHKKSFDFIEIVEPGAVYYLAPFKISNDNEALQIDISILPEGGKKPIAVGFQKRFYLN